MKKSPTQTPTLGQFLEHARPAPSRMLASVLQAISLAARRIAHEVRRAGLTDLLGRAGAINVQGEEVQKLDLLANDNLITALEETGYVGVMGSEENADPIVCDAPGDGSLAVVLDPLDGSSNINVAAPVATVFGILRRPRREAPGDLSDLLQPGSDFLAAGRLEPAGAEFR
ncbi:MAG: class 1 fructose-bisphosphatase, partial [Acidobacteriota bacterium]